MWAYFRQSVNFMTGLSREDKDTVNTHIGYTFDQILQVRLITVDGNDGPASLRRTIATNEDALKMVLTINFLEDLKKQLAVELQQFGCALSGKESEHDLLCKWYDYHARAISRRPRAVLESPEFQQARRDLTTDRQNALQRIEEKLKKGDDVTGHLSKRILNAGSPDLLLADWRIHHIHISDTKASPNQMFFDRSDKLAFALITPDAAYFVNICDHNQRNVWTDTRLLEIVRGAWPNLLRPFVLPPIKRTRECG
jgi:hypothetical protein